MQSNLSGYQNLLSSRKFGAPEEHQSRSILSIGFQAIHSASTVALSSNENDISRQHTFAWMMTYRVMLLAFLNHDSRLLTNLIQQEKEYSKQVNHLLDSSCATLAALAAYAASSPPPVSHVIMELTGTLGASDAALKRYALGVDEWRETMRTLKDAEEEVGNIMRDREILVTRLIKASKSQKGGARDSLLLSPQTFPSSSSLSLSTSGQNDSPSPPPSRPLSSSYSTSSKLAAAQTELQACEAHLASKERELEQKRSAAIRDGLGIRMKAMMDCGWAWNELGKEALRTLDQLRKSSDRLPQDEQFSRSDSRTIEGSRPFSDFSSIGPSQSVSQVNSMHNAPPPVSMAAVLNTGAFGEVQHGEDEHEPELLEHAQDEPQPSLNDQQVISDSSNGSSLSKLATPTTYKIETVTYAPAVPLFISGKDAAPPVPKKAESIKSDYSSIHVPPPHAIEGYTYGYPTAAPSESKEDVISPRSTPTTSPAPTPQRRSSFTSPPIISAFHTHKLERRITEEDVRRRSLGGTSQKSDDASDREDKLLQEGKLEVVENPRFMSEARRKEIEAEKEKEHEQAQRTAEAGVSRAPEAVQRQSSGTLDTGKQKPVIVDDDVERTPGKEKKRFAFFHSGKDTTPTKGAESRPPMRRAHDSDAHLSVSDAGKSTNTSPSKGGFFGGIKNLFAPRQLPSHPEPSSPSKLQDSPVLVERNDMSDSDEESPKQVLSKRRGLFSSRTHEEKRQKGWETRTDKNLREITRAGSFNEDLERRPYQSKGVGASTVASVGLGTPSTVPNVGAGVAQRNRTSSEVGTSTAPTVPGTVQGRKLKKRGPGAAGSPGIIASDNENYFETRPPPHSTPLSVPRAPTMPKIAPTARTATGPQWLLNEHRRSSSVDGTMGNRKSWTEDENGAMIVDLGRRRVASEVGAPGVAAQATAIAADNKPLKSAIRSPQPQARQYQQPHVHMQSQQPHYHPQPQTVSAAPKAAHVVANREYASDTGAAPSAQVPRKKSLTKKKPQAPESTVSTSALPPPVPASPLLSSLGPVVAATPPARRASVKSTAASTIPPPPAAAAAAGKKVTPPTVGGATVMPAGGKHPSGTLVSEPGWATQAHTQGGALSRNTSSASAGSAAARRKQTVLGQGMGTSGENRRTASLGPATGAPVVAPTSQHTKAASGGTLIQPLGPAASLMSIVEDVARVNREGWGRDAKVQKSVGGSQVPTGMIDVVKAPPPMGRKYYEALSDQKTTAQPTVPQVPIAPPATTTSRTGMFEVTAPKSVFEQREKLVQSTTMASTTPPAQPRPQVVSQPQYHPQPVGPGKVPLRSALRTSRSPSPVITTSRAQASASPKPLPPPVDGRLPWDGDNSSTPRFTKAEKGKAPVRGPPPPPDDESGDESNYETGDEMLDAQDAVGPDGRPKFVRRSSSGRRTQNAAPPPAVNGHAVGHEQADKPREAQLSHSAASTVVGQPRSVASPVLSENQEPRRRKSVRVSLQPTFSPSPPAIEYDDEEEQKLHAPWAFTAERPIERERQPLVLQAPAPVYPQPAQTIASSHVDMWADSDEEDQEYLKAKRLLSRAAKKEKDSLSNAFTRLNTMSDEEQQQHTQDPEPKLEDSNTTINIKVVSAAGEEVFFKIKRSTKLSKLQGAYASKVGKDVNSIRFLYDGTRINDDDTPATLDMEDNVHGVNPLQTIQIDMSFQPGIGNAAGLLKPFLPTARTPI
ncbi:hypothetical protein D9619_008759 [Psilocybe cf. subviscida]|uniref:Ubiquitin-like domain-containing protein n=1 Tax=Psilocybe cf. subviscida TaxID=2480587 RepID=A0A8H5F0X8_9AGAR|nr:hypothetical protein D9619_008759 [Psilocybe cf. subviscida]